MKFGFYRQMNYTSKPVEVEEEGRFMVRRGVVEKSLEIVTFLSPQYKLVEELVLAVMDPNHTIFLGLKKLVRKLVNNQSE